MQNSRSTLFRITAVLAVTVTFLFLEGAVDAEVSLEKMAQNCLLLENFWELNKERNDDMVYPTSGAAVCFGYLMAVRGLEEVVDGTYCSSQKINLARVATNYTSVCQNTPLTHRYWPCFLNMLAPMSQIGVKERRSIT